MNTNNAMLFDPQGEEILDDDYPVYGDYWYVLDGEPRRSDVFGTVRDLKRDTGAKEVRRCNMKKRNMFGRKD